MSAVTPGGFVRRLDDLGRVVIPIEWRRVHNVGPGAPLEIIPGRDGSLMLQRYVPGGACIFCGELEEVKHFGGRPVCRKCAGGVGALAQL